MKLRKNIRIRAVPVGSGVKGLVRISGSMGVSKIDGICAPFSGSLNLSDLQLRANPEELFFYGNEVDFQKNRLNWTAKNKIDGLFDKYLASTYSVKYDYTRGFAKIPLDEIQLRNSQLELIANLFEEANTILIKSPQMLDRVDVPQKGTTSSSSLKGYLNKYFGPDFFDLAQEAGFYFGLRESGTTEVKTEYTIPRVYFQPVGKAPTKR